MRCSSSTDTIVMLSSCFDLDRHIAMLSSWYHHLVSSTCTSCCHQWQVEFDRHNRHAIIMLWFRQTHRHAIIILWFRHANLCSPNEDFGRKNNSSFQNLRLGGVKSGYEFESESDCSTDTVGWGWDTSSSMWETTLARLSRSGLG